MIKELEARIAVIIIAAAAPIAILQKRILAEKDNIISEVSPKVMSITSILLVFPKKKSFRSFIISLS